MSSLVDYSIDGLISILSYISSLEFFLLLLMIVTIVFETFILKHVAYSFLLGYKLLVLKRTFGSLFMPVENFVLIFLFLRFFLFFGVL